MRTKGWSLSTGRVAWAVLAAAVLSHIVLGVLLFDPKPFVGGDNAGYMALAESIEKGLGYRDVYLPDTPRHAQYPPVYPAILALTRALGGSLVAFKALSLVFTATALIFLFLLGKRRLGDEAAIALSLGFALNPVLLYYSHWVLSEAPFVLFTLVALWAAEGMEDSNRYLGLALGAGILAYLTRAAGLPLLLALLIALGWRREWRRLGVAAVPIVAAVGAWWTWGRLAASESAQRYSSNFLLIDPYNPARGYVGPGELLARLLNTLSLYSVDVLPQSLGGIAAAGGGINLLALLVGLGVIALALVAWIRRIRQGRASEWFVLFYTGLICLWPTVWTDRRFLLPLLPLLLLYALDGLDWCFEFLRARRPIWVLPAVGGILLLLTVPHQIRTVSFNQECLRFYRLGDRLACYPPPWRAFVESAYWVRDNTDRDAIIVNRKPRLFYHFSGRRGDVYPFTTAEDAVFAFLDRIGADYVVVSGVSGTSARYLIPVIRSRRERFELVYTIGEGTAAALVLRYGGNSPIERLEGAR